MTGVDWGTEANEAPKPKKRVPTWAWFCGGGCLLALIATVAVFAFGAMKVREMVDTEKQAEELQRELPFDQLPEGAQLIGTGAFASFAPGIDDAWAMQFADGSQCQITKYTPKVAAEMRENIKSGELGKEAEQRLGPFGIFAIENGVVDIQGRTIHWLRFQTYDPDAVSADETETEPAPEDEAPTFGEAMDRAFKQRVMLLDVTREDARGALIIQYQKVGRGAPIDPQQVAEFLAPFHIGPNR